MNDRNLGWCIWVDLRFIYLVEWKGIKVDTLR